VELIIVSLLDQVVEPGKQTIIVVKGDVLLAILVLKGKETVTLTQIVTNQLGKSVKWILASIKIISHQLNSHKMQSILE
jgi:hypothetical protein